MHHHLILKLSLFFLIATFVAPLEASRLALIIGNSNYKISSRLPNPANDANDLKKVLKKLGFQVILKTNANRRSMIKAIQKFGKRLHRADVGLFFYAGHGLEFNGNNYLVPIDANIQNQADIEHEAVNVSRVLTQMELSNNGVNIIILDACRNNPYKRGTVIDLTKGLIRLNPPIGTFISYATNSGNVADDGRGRNSPFTRNLLWALKVIPKLKIEELFKKVAKRIVEEQNLKDKNPQRPWIHSSLIDDFCFTACPGINVSKKLKECKKHLKANRLTTGRGGTAFVCYKEVLTKDPNNFEAENGLKKIEELYANWIKKALYRGQLYKAKRYFPRLCKINPESSHLAKIKKRLKTSCPEFKRSSRSIKTRKGFFHDILGDGSSGPEMLWIQSSESISRFAIGRYEVTFAEYNKFVEATGREKPDDQDWGYDKRPVINISWEEAMAYAEWLSDETGQKYSLPTESEWQSANNIELIQNYTCNKANLKDCSDGYDYTAPVGEFKPNKLGLFDMSGNVSEWTCSDKHNNNKCVGEKPSNPIIILGDSWYTTETRMSYPYELRDEYIGFRLVRH